MIAFAYAGGFFKGLPITPPNAPDAERWRAYRYAVNTLKPAIEPILVASKPFERNGRHSIRKYGAGAWNIERGRIPAATDEHLRAAPLTKRPLAFPAAQGQLPREQRADSRVPANFLLLHNFDCTPKRCTHGCAVRVLDATTPCYRSDGYPRRSTSYRLAFARPSLGRITYTIGDAGTAVRFFYRADWLPEQVDPILPAFIYGAKASPNERDAGLKGVIPPINDTFLAHRHNPHPSVKPIKLCAYLSGMLLPPPEYAPRRLLVPFSGVGSEMIGALLAGWDEVVGIEISPEYNHVAELRIKHWTARHAADQLSFHSFDTPSVPMQADAPDDLPADA